MPTQTRCRLYLDLKVSKDGGAFSNTDGDAVVWKFGNNDFYLKKRVTQEDQYSQIGIYTFKFTILQAWDNAVVPGTIEDAFTVTVTGPSCYPVLSEA